MMAAAIERSTHWEKTKMADNIDRPEDHIELAEN